MSDLEHFPQNYHHNIDDKQIISISKEANPSNNDRLDFLQTNENWCGVIGVFSIYIGRFSWGMLFRVCHGEPSGTAVCSTGTAGLLFFFFFFRGTVASSIGIFDNSHGHIGALKYTRRSEGVLWKDLAAHWRFENKCLPYLCKASRIPERSSKAGKKIFLFFLRVN